MGENRSCSICEIDEAEVFCICSDLPLLCAGCRPSHEAKPDFHFSLPAQAYDHVNRHNQMQYKIWLFSLNHSQERLRDNMKAMDQCRADLEACFLKMRRELNELRTQVLQKLEEMKEALGIMIEQAVEETSTHAYLSDYEPTTYLANLVWTQCCEQRPDPIPVFTYQIHPDMRVEECLEIAFRTSVPDLEGFNYTSQSYFTRRENEELKFKLQELPKILEETKKAENGNLAELDTSSSMHPSVCSDLVHITPSTFRFFNFTTSTWDLGIDLRQHIRASNDSTWVVLDDRRVFCCGGEL